MNEEFEKAVLKAVYESGLHQYAPEVLRVVWKDGIDLNEPSPSLLNFAKKIVLAGQAAERKRCAEIAREHGLPAGFTIAKAIEGSE